MMHLCFVVIDKTICLFKECLHLSGVIKFLHDQLSTSFENNNYSPITYRNVDINWLVTVKNNNNELAFNWLVMFNWLVQLACYVKK